MPLEAPGTTDVASPAFPSFGARLRAYLHMTFVDHGFFRLVYLNRHALGRDAFRCAQPAPHHIRLFKKRGVKTIVNLRGAKGAPTTLLEIDACAQAGLAYREVKLKSRDAPKREAIEAVAKLLEEIEYPAVFHCKAGADRAGLLSALFMIFREGATIAEAKRQLSWRFGHISQGPTGILDGFMDLAHEAEKRAEARGERFDFLAWVREEYDRDALSVSWRSSRWGQLLVDRVLRRE